MQNVIIPVIVIWYNITNMMVMMMMMMKGDNDIEKKKKKKDICEKTEIRHFTFSLRYSLWFCKAYKGNISFTKFKEY